jgi:hypothetical protein
MDHTTDILLADLRHVIADLGKNGGQISPSVYDTAQVIRLAPPSEGMWPALNWLAGQQQPDGGWGDPAMPHARAVPTLAAVLALHTHGTRSYERVAVHTGLVFLRRQATDWERLSDNLPVGVELLLPYLLEESANIGLELSQRPYAALLELGNRRRQLIATLSLRAGTPAVHSWEAWGVDPDPGLIDGSGGVGHSPAATAAWLWAAGEHDALAHTRATARNYLEQAAAATDVGIPGVVPTVWPIVRFEQSNALYALFVAGLLKHPGLHDVVQPQIDSLARALRPDGLGMSDFFISDGDDTSKALAVLHADGRSIDRNALNSFVTGDHFCAYPNELQPSLSVTAHAIHLLSLLNLEHSRPLSFVTARQLRDGRWLGDKWNGSWLYTTTQAMIAIQQTDSSDVMSSAVEALLLHQHNDGGWGTRDSTAEETAYAILALRALRSGRVLIPAAQQALAHGEDWMRANYRPFYRSSVACWLGKEIYRPYRLARTIELAATFPSNV